MSSVNVLKHALRNDDDVARLQPDIRLAFALLQQVRDTQGIFGLFSRCLVEADQASLVARRIFGKPAHRDHCIAPIGRASRRHRVCQPVSIPVLPPPLTHPPPPHPTTSPPTTP